MVALTTFSYCTRQGSSSTTATCSCCYGSTTATNSNVDNGEWVTFARTSNADECSTFTPALRRPQKPSPAYVLPVFPVMRAYLSPWKDREYMLRRKP